MKRLAARGEKEEDIRERNEWNESKRTETNEKRTSNRQLGDFIVEMVVGIDNSVVQLLHRLAVPKWWLAKETTTNNKSFQWQRKSDKIGKFMRTAATTTTKIGQQGKAKMTATAK